MQRAANVWDRFYRLHEAPWRGERPIAPLAPFLGVGPVLELGCGNGKLLRPLTAAGVRAVGLDISFHALRRLPPEHLRVMADAAQLPFGNGIFSAVLDFHCTGHLGLVNRAAAALECHRVLQPNGHLVVERLTPHDLRASQGEPVAGEAGMRAVQDGRRTHFSHASELALDFAAAGFHLLEAQEHTKHPGHRGRQVTRESVRLVMQRQ